MPCSSCRAQPGEKHTVDDLGKPCSKRGQIYAEAKAKKEA